APAAVRSVVGEPAVRILVGVQEPRRIHGPGRASHRHGGESRRENQPDNSSPPHVSLSPLGPCSSPGDNPVVSTMQPARIHPAPGASGLVTPFRRGGPVRERRSAVGSWWDGWSPTAASRNLLRAEEAGSERTSDQSGVPLFIEPAPALSIARAGTLAGGGRTSGTPLLTCGRRSSASFAGAPARPGPGSARRAASSCRPLVALL